MIGPEPPYRPKVLIVAPRAWLCVQNLDHFKRRQEEKRKRSAQAYAQYRIEHPEFTQEKS